MNTPHTEFEPAPHRPPLEESRFLHLLTKVAVIANEATVLDDALQDCLSEICRYAGWPVGHVYLCTGADPPVLSPTTIWYFDDPTAYEALRRVTERTPLNVGEGLPGRVVLHRKPAWIEDVRLDPNFPRNTDPDLEITTGLAFPLVVGKDVPGVMEFFSREPLEPDAATLELMEYVGSQLGRVIERHRATRALEEREQRSRLIIDKCSDAFVAIDGNGLIRDWNAVAERTFGWTAAEPLGRPLTETIIPPRYREAHLRGLKHFLATGEGPVLNRRIEISALNRDAGGFPVDLTTSPFGSKAEYRFSAFIQDITTRKRPKPELRQLNATLEQRVEERTRELRQLNAELEQFVYLASHDLQEPLRGISGFAQLLGRQYRGKLDPKADEFIAFILEGVTQMQNLIQDLLAYSHAGSGPRDFRRVAGEELLTQAQNRLRLAIRESGALITHDPLPVVMGDETQLTQLFQNLLGNAIKFRRVTPPHIHVSATGGDGAHRFAVRDDGIGIAPEHLQQIFVVFRRLQTKAQYPGTGIGLASCKKIVEHHGGNIWAESSPGEGSVFYFTLPSEPRKDAA